MFSNMFTLLAFVAFVASCALASVQDLNPAQFDSLVATPSVSVVLFYAPWCTYSKAFMPVFESIGAHFQSSDNNVLIGRVNGEDIAAAHLLAARGVVSFPTVLLFAAGRSHPQENFDRTFDSIVLHVHRMRLPLVPLINSDAALDELASLGHMQALLLFPSSNSEASHIVSDAPVETDESSSPDLQSEVSDTNSSTSHQSSVLRPNLPSLSSAAATLRFESTVCFPDSNVKPLISAIGALAELNSGYSFGVVTNTSMIMRLLRLAGIAGISGTNNLPPAMECRPWLVVARQPGLSIYTYPAPTAHIPASSSQPTDLSSISSTLFTSAMESELPVSASQSSSKSNVAARSATPIAASSMPTPIEWRRVSAWLKQVGVPLVGEFNRATAAAYVAKPLPLLVLFLDSSISAEDADSQAALSLMRIVAPEFAHRVSFVYADALTFAEQLLRIGNAFVCSSFRICFQPS
jgi:thiol-disulfide isomerase/thioredoxin